VSKKVLDALASLSNLQTLDLENNLLPKLSESMKKPSEIIDYLLQHQKSEKRPMNEVKVLVVGDERVGKTSVVRRLTKDEFNENETSTKGVAISSFDIDSECSTQMNGVKLNIWDFAGQQVTHTPHQYFMTEQSLYMLVLDAQVEDSKNFHTIRYWLDMIKSYAGSEVPVVIVVNKVDKNSGYRFDINKYRQTYPNIVEDVLYLSSKNGESFQNLKNIISNEVSSLESVKELFPVSYHNVKNDLEELKEDYIEDREYFKICERHEVVEEREQRLLLKVLNAMGTIVSYSDSLNLDRTYVINPEWVTNAVYEIIRSEHLKNSNGILKLDDLSKILDPMVYKKEQYSWIIALMERFEVCFSFDKNEVLIPAVFENLEPEIHFEDYEDGYRLRIIYEFLPKSVISKFMVRTKDMIKDNLYWRDGVILEYESVTAVVKVDELKNSVDIYLLNNGTYSRDFLNIIRREFKAISENKLKYNERIPLYLPQHKGQFVPYKQLVSIESKGVLTNYFGQPDPEEYDIRKLLHGYEPQENLAKINKLIHYLKSNPSEQNKMFLKDILEIHEKKEEGIMNRALDKMSNFNTIMKYAKNSHELGSIVEKLF
jgi:small GTP-binding protein